MHIGAKAAHRPGGAHPPEPARQHGRRRQARRPPGSAATLRLPGRGNGRCSPGRGRGRRACGTRATSRPRRRARGPPPRGAAGSGQAAAWEDGAPEKGRFGHPPRWARFQTPGAWTRFPGSVLGPAPGCLARGGRRGSASPRAQRRAGRGTGWRQRPPQSGLEEPRGLTSWWRGSAGRAGGGGALGSPRGTGMLRCGAAGGRAGACRGAWARAAGARFPLGARTARPEPGRWSLLKAGPEREENTERESDPRRGGVPL